MRSLRLILPAVLFLGSAVAQEITSPEKFFGFQLGADKKMARWDKIVEYYGVLEKQSGGRMKVINMGPTSMGNPVPHGDHHVAGQLRQARAPARRSISGSAIRAESRRRRPAHWRTKARRSSCSR